MMDRLIAVELGIFEIVEALRSIVAIRTIGIG